jgi:Tol biopolymer transport system component
MDRFLTRNMWIGLSFVLASGGAWQAEKQTSAQVWIGQKIWQDNAAGASGDISSDGRLLTFVNSSPSDLSIRDLSSGTNRVLVKGRGIYGNVISPDGTHVAFTAFDLQRRIYELNVVPMAGGNFRTIDPIRGFEVTWVQDWTPDGRELLVVNTVTLEKPGEIGFIDVETGRYRSVGSVEPGASASVSPDGSRIVVSELARPHHTERDIRVIEVGTGRSQSILTGPSNDYSAAWAPDGRTIYFLSERNSRAQLWSTTLGRTGTFRPEPLHEIPDGADRIIGITRDGRVLVGAAQVGGTTTIVADVDWNTGTVHHTREVTHPPLRGSRRSSLSPNGEQVVFMRRARAPGVGPGWQIPVVQSYDGSNERVYQTTLTLRDEPYWFPDGSGILFVAPPEGAIGQSGRLWRFLKLDLRKGTYTELRPIETPGIVRIAGLVADEAFYLVTDVTSSVQALNLKTGARREIYRANVELRDASVSSDGTRVVFPAPEPDKTVGLFVVSPGTEPQRIASLQQGGSQLMWFSDGESVLTRGNFAGETGIWRIFVDGRAPVRLKLEADELSEARASMDGRRVTFTRILQRQGEVWEYGRRP